MIIDTHCHYNLEPLDDGQESWKQHWNQAQEDGISHSMVVGTSLTSSQRAVEIAATDSHILAAIGIHPSEYQETLEKDISLNIDQHISDQISELTKLASISSVAAIGETGLDYFRLPDDPKLQTLIKKTQQEAFKSQLELSIKLNLPIIIHVRDTDIPTEITQGNAYWDVISILESTIDDHGSLPPFILHCVSGPISYIEAALKLGAYIGVAGNVTYKNANHIRSLVKLAPVSKLLLETDAPFLPPQPHRGQPCEPWMIRLTAEFLEDELGISREVLTSNARSLFKNFN